MSAVEAEFACMWEGHGDTVLWPIRWCPSPGALTLTFETLSDPFTLCLVRRHGEASVPAALIDFNRDQ